MAQMVGAEESPHERALVPLLDLVFQLIMFFIVSVNFVTEQVSQDIQLPTAQSARPMGKGEIDVLFLNLNQEGKLMVLGRNQPLSLGEARVFLKEQYRDAERLSKDGKVRTAVIIRADLRANYGDVFDVMQMCKGQGYKRLKLRAMTSGGNG